MSFNRINTGSVITSGFFAGADSFFEDARKNLESALFHNASPVGGSKSAAFMGSGWQAIKDAVPILVAETESNGGIYRVLVALKCANPATTITPRLRNITDNDGTGDVTGTPHASTSWAVQTLLLPVLVGKTFEVQGVKSDDFHPVWLMSHLTRRVI